MFFPRMSTAVGEMVRVAKPGARISAAVWGRAAENPWASLILGTIARHTELPVPPAGTPGLFRCAAQGFMTRMFRDAGLVDVSERKVSTDLVQESPELYWEFMTDIATTVAVGLARADREARELIRTDVFRAAGPLRARRRPPAPFHGHHCGGDPAVGRCFRAVFRLALRFRTGAARIRGACV